ncbi:MAG: hypothetical protein ACYSTN_09095, partial [Planctomycetota bacterium]
MTRKRDTTKGTQTRTAKNKKQCPKCKRNTLRKGSKTAAGKQRWICREGSGERKVCYTTTNPDAPYRGPDSKAKEPDQNPQFRKPLGGIKRFVITAAQNATPLHMDFFNSLRTY